MIARGEDEDVISRISREIKPRSKQTVAAVCDRRTIPAKYRIRRSQTAATETKLARDGAARRNYVIREHLGQFVLQLAPEQQKVYASLD